MRKGLGILALLASVALVVPSNGLKAQSSSTNGTNFVTGYTPQNIVFKPMNFGSGVTPLNMQQSVSPQTAGPKVFNISSAMPNIHFPSPTPTRVTGQKLIAPHFPAAKGMTQQQQKQFLQQQQMLQQNQIQKMQQQ